MKILVKLGALLGAIALAGTAHAQAAFPSKPVTLMVPYTAGGQSDVLARIVNTTLARHLGQPVMVENLAGAGGSIAATKVLNAPADGYYLFQGSPNELVLATLANAAIKVRIEDFRPVHVLAWSPLAIVAGGDFPARNADELAALVARRAREDKPVTYASVGNGSFYHLLGEQMSKTLGTPMVHVPYKGGADVLRDLLGGQVDLFITPYGAPHVAMHKQGRLRMVASMSPQRVALLPDVPSVNEGQALKGFTHSIWTAFFVRKDTPEPVVRTLHKAIAETLADPAVRAALEAQGMDVPKAQTLEQAARATADGAALFRGIARSINLQPQ